MEVGIQCDNRRNIQYQIILWILCLINYEDIKTVIQQIRSTVSLIDNYYASQF